MNLNSQAAALDPSNSCTDLVAALHAIEVCIHTLAFLIYLQTRPYLFLHQEGTPRQGSIYETVHHASKYFYMHNDRPCKL